MQQNNSSHYSIQILVNIIFFSTVLFAPLWGVVMAAGLLLVYTEGVALIVGGILMDILFAPADMVWGIPYIYTLASLFIFFVVKYIKKQMVFYNT